MPNDYIEKIALFIADLEYELDWFISSPINRDMADLYSTKIDTIYELLGHLECLDEVRERVVELLEEYDNDEEN